MSRGEGTILSANQTQVFFASTNQRRESLLVLLPRPALDSTSMYSTKTAAIRKIDGHIFCWMDKPIQNLTRGHPVAIYVRKGQYGLDWEQSDDPSTEMLLIGN